MPLNVKIKVFLYLCLWFLVSIIIYSALGVLWAIPYVLVSLYFLYKIYPKFDLSPDVDLNGKGKLIALTFDDGPTKGFTEEILKVLKDRSVTATFFVIGNKAQKNKDILEQIISQGCELGAHTLNHIKLHNASYSKIKDEISPVISLLEDIHSASGKEFKRIFRSPHGFKNFALKRYLKTGSIKLIPWTRGVWDTDAPGSSWIEEKATANPRKNEIILLHDGLGRKEDVDDAQKQGVLEALPKIIDFYKSHGYTFVKVSEFIKE